MPYNDAISGFIGARDLQMKQNASDMQQATGTIGILQAIQKQQQEQQLRGILSSDLPPDQKQKALMATPGGIDILGKLATQQNAGITGALNTAKIAEIGSKIGATNRQQGALSQLQNQFSPAAYNQANPNLQQPVSGMLPPQVPQFAPGTGNPDIKENPTPADMAAIEAFKAAGAANGERPMSMVAPNMQTVQNLALQVDPKAAITALLKPAKAADASPLARLIEERQKLPPGDPRGAVYDKYIEHLTNPKADTVPHPIAIQGENGPVYVSPQEAIGKPPASKTDINLAGGRESVYINRVVQAGNQASKDLENIVRLPMTSSRGFFGGRGQGTGIFDAGKETLANKMTTQEVQSYNTLSTGFQRTLAAIEASGLSPNSGLSHQMDAILFKEGDTNFTKLQKLAQIRQIVESGMETTLANPRITGELKNHISEIITRLQKSVPFTQGDLITLQEKQQLNPDVTLKDVVAAKTGASTQPEFATEADAIKSGVKGDVMIGGRKARID